MVYYGKYFIITNEKCTKSISFIEINIYINFGIKTNYLPNQNIDIYFLFVVNLLKKNSRNHPFGLQKSIYKVVINPNQRDTFRIMKYQTPDISLNWVGLILVI